MEDDQRDTEGLPALVEDDKVQDNSINQRMDVFPMEVDMETRWSMGVGAMVPAVEVDVETRRSMGVGAMVPTVEVDMDEGSMVEDSDPGDGRTDDVR